MKKRMFRQLHEPVKEDVIEEIKKEVKRGRRKKED